MKHLLKFVFLFSISLALFSCASPKKMIYYQNIDELDRNAPAESFEPMLQPDDLIKIVVLAENPEAAAPFNVFATGDKELSKNGQPDDTYLIDVNGKIRFPIVGELHLAGLTKTEAKDLITTSLAKYLSNHSVNLTIMNFKVTVQGEVVKPGIINLLSERLTLVEALSMAGDLTIYGKRQNILLIRESNGKKTFARVDITKADFINSPYYYLAQNDIVYVEPNRTKVDSSVIGPNTAVVFSVITLLMTIIALTIK